MKLEKRMIAYLVLSAVVGLFATFNRENGSIYMGFMIVSFSIITVSVRATYLLVRGIARMIEGEATTKPRNEVVVETKATETRVGGNHGRAPVQQ